MTQLPALFAAGRMNPDLRLTHDDAQPWVREAVEHSAGGEAERLEDGTLALDGIPWETRPATAST